MPPFRAIAAISTIKPARDTLAFLMFTSKR